jgi:predicted Zn-dependent peptidase
MAMSIVTSLPFEQIRRYVQRSWFVKTGGGENPSCISSISSISSLPFINHSLEPQSDIRFKLSSITGCESNAISIGFRVCGFSSSDKYCLRLLKNILGDTFNSRVYTILREKNGLIYHPDVTIAHYEYYGDFILSLTTKPGFVVRVLKLLSGILHDLQKNGVRRDELQLAKGRKRGRIELGKMDIENQVEKHLDEWLLGTVGPTSTDEYAEFYQPIQKRHMDEVIRKYFVREGMCVAIMGARLPTLKMIQAVFQ